MNLILWDYSRNVYSNNGAKGRNRTSDHVVHIEVTLSSVTMKEKGEREIYVLYQLSYLSSNKNVDRALPFYDLVIPKKHQITTIKVARVIKH